MFGELCVVYMMN